MTHKLDWLHQCDKEYIVLAYGSLLNRASREQHNDVYADGLGVMVQGWERSWITRSESEKQSYVGARPNISISLSALALPMMIDEKLVAREKDYRFTEVDFSCLHFDTSLPQHLRAELSKKKFVICESLLRHEPNHSYPVNQSYIDTCLAGAIESGGQKFAERFVETSSGWDSLYIVNDRHAPMYPRFASLSKRLHNTIDMLLQNYR
ncbi:gamma-glutamylcyclotransferase [Glaciecola sp. MH2013]|uniref:gamma-glutamylcyclotransferase n=1 Tax=Glaciecola sp. MH2013 TaxID=2785524 RepID=UPI00189D8C03|nr:gamma-glutamylcyclotransferase [Glaciecola sp. MH2013]MBF7071892.1 gamma-glutamylcyclotransferase [Glaciecola sp. MH2013]